MAAPKRSYKVGTVQMACWENEFKDEKTGKTNISTSFTMKKQKFNKDTEKFEDTDFLSVTDLKDIIVMCQKAIEDYYFEAEPF